jgi:hypothetical protein
MYITRGIKTIIVNCQLNKHPNRKPKKTNATASQMTPNLVPVIS